MASFSPIQLGEDPPPITLIINILEHIQVSVSRFLYGMMRLSHHNTVTGGTTHGWCTVHRAAVPSDGVPGFYEPDARRVSAGGPTLRGGVPTPDGGVAHGWKTGDGTRG